MKLYLFIVSAILVFILSSAGIYVLLTRDDVLQIVEVPVRMRVSDYVGFNLDTDALNLGTVIPGGRANRNISITNEYPHAVIVHVDVEGPMGDWLMATENDFMMGSLEKKSVKFIASPPRGTPYDDYEASVYFRFSDSR